MSVHPVPRLAEVVYPESDGKPMAETDFHLLAMIDLISALREHYRADPQVYVGGNMLCYYEEGNPKAAFAPDVFVVLGVVKRKRRVYKLWEEGVAPTCVIELTSRSTKREDTHHKRALYARLGVAEYFLFDPLEEYLRPALLGYVLVAGTYAPLLPDGAGRLHSAALDMHLQREGEHLALITATGERLLTPTQLAAARRAEVAARRVAEERARTFAAERHAEATARRVAEEEWRLAEARAITFAEERHAEAAARRLAEARALILTEERRIAEEERRLAEEQARTFAEERRIAEERAAALAAENARLLEELKLLRGA